MMIVCGFVGLRDRPTIHRHPVEYVGGFPVGGEIGRGLCQHVGQHQAPGLRRASALAA